MNFIRAETLGRDEQSVRRGTEKTLFNKAYSHTAYGTRWFAILFRFRTQLILKKTNLSAVWLETKFVPRAIHTERHTDACLDSVCVYEDSKWRQCDTYCNTLRLRFIDWSESSWMKEKYTAETCCQTKMHGTVVRWMSKEWWCCHLFAFEKRSSRQYKWWIHLNLSSSMASESLFIVAEIISASQTYANCTRLLFHFVQLMRTRTRTQWFLPFLVGLTFARCESVAALRAA